VSYSSKTSYSKGLSTLATSRRKRRQKVSVFSNKSRRKRRQKVSEARRRKR